MGFLTELSTTVVMMMPSGVVRGGRRAHRQRICRQVQVAAGDPRCQHRRQGTHPEPLTHRSSYLTGRSIKAPLSAAHCRDERASVMHLTVHSFLLLQGSAASGTSLLLKKEHWCVKSHMAEGDSTSRRAGHVITL
jgi:hypothetical protein